jgi:hypothetical protein
MRGDGELDTDRVGRSVGAVSIVSGGWLELARVMRFLLNIGLRVLKEYHERRQAISLPHGAKITFKANFCLLNAIRRQRREAILVGSVGED